VAQIPTGKSPVRVGLTADGKTLIYALFGENKVGFADIAERRELAKNDLEGQPVSLEMSADGRYAFAGAQDAGVVYVISAADRTIVKQFPTAQGAGPDPVMQIPGTTLP
jgi:DNA-binding beta-propeller fold protein YncE